MGKREIINRRRQKGKSGSKMTIIFIIAAFTLVAVGMVILSQYKPVGAINTPSRELARQRDGLIMGDPSAKVKVVEFADFQCPACASYWEVLEPTIIKTYIDAGKVQFEYSPFSFLGSRYSWDESVKSAEAAYCANDQGNFWEYRDMIFANHNGENQGAYSRERLLAFAAKLDLNQADFKACLDSGASNLKVQEANNFASEQGASYTPSFLINGTIVSANELIQAIESALAE